MTDKTSTIEISNIRHGTTKLALETLLRGILREVGGRDQDLISLSYGHVRAGKATAEIPARFVAAVSRDVQLLRWKDLSFRGHGLEARTIQSVSATTYREDRARRSWPFHDSTAMSPAEQAASNYRDLEQLFSKLPDSPMRASLWALVLEMDAAGNKLKEFYLALGRSCEVVFTRSQGARGNVIRRSGEVTTEEHLSEFWPLFQALSAAQRRTGIPGTLHRISRTIHAISGEAIGVTARVGRTIQGHVAPMLSARGGTAFDDLAAMAARGILLIGPPNVGKTTVLRELARLLSRTNEAVVVVVDKSLEVCGTDVVPHASIGNARVLTVGPNSSQAAVMVEAVENQSPDIVIVDELSSREECQAARTIAGRGVAVIASVHGETLAQLCADPERNLLLGSVTSVTLSAREAERRRDKLRQVQRRMATPVFGVAVELRGFGEMVIHDNVERLVDALLDYEPFPAVLNRHIESSRAVQSDPIVGMRLPGNSFTYMRLRQGSRIPSAEDGGADNDFEVDFTEKNAHGQALWTSISETSPEIWEANFASV